ncbi:hypothetical protein ARMSODRAFT_881019 [Armillaria solidipes]|uniref:Uncharacterized protein n=1 Tax=Armillaria solidipes TaxID=1076256 RepID=A0A2H3BQN5_9AGAR|nr:hypothetical protein ARMSODRAFT_881019 [Armillaria solidipes]
MLFKGGSFDPMELYAQPYASPDDPLLKEPSPDASPISGHQDLHGVEKNFEAPEWHKIIIHVILCLIAYPFLFLSVKIAQNRTLFWSRLIVSVGCGVIGFALGLSLLSLGRPFLEAATWATVIHQSNIKSGIRLSDMAAASRDPTSAWPALRLLWSRFMYPGTARKMRQTYDKRPWSLAIIFFLLNVILAASLSFVFGRIVNIATSVSHQRIEYQEVTVKGDLSESDISNAAALAPAFNDFSLTWTLSPFSAHGSLPPAISYPWNNDTVYFSEASLSQFLPDGSGFGTFTENTTTPTRSTNTATVATDFSTGAIQPGSLLRYPRWGIRIHCEKIPDGTRNIIPRSSNGFTYLFTPRETMKTLFSSFGRVFSSGLEESVTDALQLNDTLPSTVDVNGTALTAYFSDNGVAHSFLSKPVTSGDEGFGWISIEWVLVRLNTTYSPSGTFAAYSNESVLDANGTETRIGYDAAVCLELYEPYIVETYNSTTGLPSSTDVISQNKEITDSSAQGAPEEKRTGKAVTGSNVKRQLNSTRLQDVYDILHGNSVNQMVKDNGRDAFYVPSPTLVSFTNGTGPYGYTELSGELFARARAQADATNVLPYFAGSADTLARQYADLVLAYASIHVLYMAGLLITVLSVGVIAGLFVPALPLHVPHRGFDIYSWLAAFRANELTHINGITKRMETKDMAKRVGDSKISYQHDYDFFHSTRTMTARK